MDKSEENNSSSKLKSYLSPFHVWALAFGCAVGWGAFVMPGTTFLPIAGPFGTVLGMLIGAIIMLVIGFNYHFMINHFPNAGGSYAYAKKILGYDHGFLSAWFILLVYVAITWANATALTIIFRNLLGDFFQVGLHYQIAGFDIYFGEAFLSLAALWIFGFICIRGGKFAAWVQTFAAVILFSGVAILFVFAAMNFDGNIFFVSPSFVPDVNPLKAIIGIVVLAPWAFVGFESISNSAEEFNFSEKKSFKIIFAALLTGVFVYISLALVASSVMPKIYNDWYGYITHLKDMTGYAGLPTIFAANIFLDKPGLILFAVTVVCAVITGLLGNYIAASRLIYSVAKDNLLPKKFCVLNKFGTPQNAILFLMIFSLPIPFLGRTAISWIIDVNTIGATIAYTYTSIVTFMTAREEKNFPAQITGVIGGIFSAIFFFYFMIPSFQNVTAMATESYLILIGWSLLGFIFFRFLLGRDEERRFGKSTIVWMVILFLIFFTSMMWLREVIHNTAKESLENLNEYYAEKFIEHGIKPTSAERAESKKFLESQMDSVGNSIAKDNWLQMILIVAALMIMFSVYGAIIKREREMELKKIEAEQSNRAKSIFLSNMSHDIRTPMNAIVGYVELSKTLHQLCENCPRKNCHDDVPEKLYDFMKKIETSSHHLLSLINDVLDMSRIESGKMELEKVDADLVKMIDDVYDIFSSQMQNKNINFSADTSKIKNRKIICDENRLNRVLLNLLSNAYKFTPEGGKISVTAEEKNLDDENFGSYEIRVKDNGIGMSKEFAAKVFEAFEREKTSTVSGIQGTGLGMAITKSIIDLMGGDIRVETEKNIGTEFIIKINFELSKEISADEKTSEENSDEFNFIGKHILLVDDIDVNREIASMLLSGVGFEVETAVNGQDAVEKISNSKPKYFSAVLMDIQMPIMDGYEAAKKIRSLENSELAKIPIIAMTANAFSEDVQNAKDSGMNGHIAKPIDVSNMIETLTRVLKNFEEKNS